MGLPRYEGKLDPMTCLLKCPPTCVAEGAAIHSVNRCWGAEWIIHVQSSVTFTLAIVLQK